MTGYRYGAFHGGPDPLALPPDAGPRLEALWRERSRGGAVAWEGIFADP